MTERSKSNIRQSLERSKSHKIKDQKTVCWSIPRWPLVSNFDTATQLRPLGHKRTIAMHGMAMVLALSKIVLNLFS